MQCYLNSDDLSCKYYPIYNVDFENGNILIFLSYKEAFIDFELHFNETGELTGTAKYVDKSSSVTFHKTSEWFAIGQTETGEFNFTDEEFKEKINQNSNYDQDSQNYEFTYDLNDKDKIKDFIEKYDLDHITNQKKDVELMQTLLNWECKMLNHDSSSIAEKRDINSLFEDGLKNGVCCRGLSLILSELLRAYGIKAQIVGCLPYTEIYNDSHVVVNAYSEELNQWIMLDPTYNMILKDEDGRYVNVQNLRNYILKDAKLTWSEGAGYNENPMTEEGLKEYMRYMAKNSCSYTKLLNNYENCDVVSDNICIILTSKDNQRAGEYTKDSKIIFTNDDKHFWN